MTDPANSAQPVAAPEIIARNWWSALSTADRAELRRAKTLAEVSLTRGANRLRLRLRSTKWGSAERIALVAATLAYVNTDDKRSLGEALAAKLKDLRFRRMISVTRHADLMRPMIRTVLLLDRTVNIPQLASMLYWWNDQTKRELAYAYYSHN